MVFLASPRSEQRRIAMGVRVKFGTVDGNTVPYPPVLNDARSNHGFVDTRGRPDLIADIPEARESAALASLLTRLAQPGSQLFSLGCDLGEHREPKARLERRCVAGGYVQLISAYQTDEGFKRLQSFGKAIQSGLNPVVGSDWWEVDLNLSSVLYKVEGEVELPSVWTWFFARASTGERAASARERLIHAIERIIATFGSSESSSALDAPTFLAGPIR